MILLIYLVLWRREQRTALSRLLFMSPSSIPNQTGLPVSPCHHVVSRMMVTNCGSVTMGTVTMVCWTIQVFVQAKLFHPANVNIIIKIAFEGLDLMTHSAFVWSR